MSEARFFNDQIKEFVARHSSSEEWKVYVCFEELAKKLYLHYIPDFIRDLHPESLKSRKMINEVRTDDMMGCEGDYHHVPLNSEWDVKKELDANNWHGDLEIEWLGSPIHYHSFSEFRHGSLDRIVLVAAKSNGVLRDFQSHLNNYGLKRTHRQRGHVMVVNGDDFQVPPVSWEDVILPHGFAQEIHENVIGFFKSREKYESFGVPYRRGFLFAGAPGCGKTYTIKALINMIDATFITLDTRHDVDDYAVKRAFYLANIHAPSVIILEELDRLVKSQKISMSYMLNALDGLRSNNGVLVIATSNHPEKLDLALLHRPSRFDRVWRFSLPDRKQRLELLRKKGEKFFSDNILNVIAERSEGFSMSYVQEVVVNALLSASCNGEMLDDSYLLKSLETLKGQKKSASKPDEDLTERESVGFSVLEQTTGY